MEGTSAMRLALSQIIRREMRFAPMVAGCLVLATATMVAAPVWGQNAVVLTDRLDRIERRLLALERHVYRGEEPPTEALTPPNNPGAVTDPMEGLHVRISEFEEQLQNLTGGIEEIGFTVRQLATRLDRLVTDMNFRLRSVEQASTAQGAAQTQSNIAPAATADVGDTTDTPQFPSVRIIGQIDQQQLQKIQTGGPGPTENQVVVMTPQAPIAPTPQIAPALEPVQQRGLLIPPQAPAPQMTALPAATPEAEYKFAYDLLFQRDYPSAEAALAEFVGKHPNHPRAGNAQYWLGETFYVRQDYMAAARAFAAGYSRYPESIKAPDNLLKLGMSLNALKRKDDACITFTKLIDEYPQATASVRRRAERERGLLACP